MSVKPSRVELYDRIGDTYAHTRREDSRLAARLHAALGDARTVVNVGAGAGSYEPRDRDVVAVEPSATMIAQRPPGSAPAVQAHAEALPFADGAFDAAMAILTIHHWGDPRAGIAELRRVARHVVILHFDPEVSTRFWLHDEYIPELTAVEHPAPAPQDVAAWLGGATVEPVPVPHDCQDGFMCAFWRRPEGYLDPAVRAGISTFRDHPDPPGLARLADDLRSGAWHRRHADLLTLDELECGYRLIVA